MDKPFKIHSKFQPTGDQPQAIEKLVKGFKEGNQFETLLGVTGKTFTMANVIEKIQKPTLVIAHNKTLAAQLYNELKEFFPENAVEYFVSYYDYYQPEAYVASTDTYIEKDVRKLIAASSEMQFRNFISIVALRTAQELHYDEIARNVGIDVRTCKKWISILETSGIIYLLQPYMANISNRIIKAPKMYFLDTGLCAYLCKWPDAEMLEKCAMSGAFYETYIVSELVKNFYAHGKTPKDFLFYYRDTDQKEIDLLYVDGSNICPIEIKQGIAPKKATKNFSVLDKYHLNITTGLVIDSCDKIRPINEQTYYIPVYLI